jgi:hypothetical protein
MRTKLIIVSIAALAALPSAATASARSKATHRYTSAIQMTTISTANGYPAVGGTAVLSGTWNATPFGKGKLVDHVKVVGQPFANVFTIAGGEVGTLPSGTLKDRFTGWAMLRPDGSLAVRITGIAFGGTGIFSGAKGTYVFDGVTPPGSTVMSGRSSGKLFF